MRAFTPRAAGAFLRDTPDAPLPPDRRRCYAAIYALTFDIIDVFAMPLLHFAIRGAAKHLLKELIYMALLHAMLPCHTLFALSPPCAPAFRRAMPMKDYAAAFHALRAVYFSLLLCCAPCCHMLLLRARYAFAFSLCLIFFKIESAMLLLRRYAARCQRCAICAARRALQELLCGAIQPYARCCAHTRQAGSVRRRAAARCRRAAMRAALRHYTLMRALMRWLSPAFLSSFLSRCFVAFSFIGVFARAF